jgi:RNA-directed DNA polymerase
MQVLQKRWNRTFSPYSYGFRPRRSAHHAVAQAQQYIAQGYGWVIDLDLEKFFDRVNHDKLMGQIAKRVEDKRLLKLIRAFLNAGVMENGLVSPSVEGTPQGGPLSPLLSNLVRTTVCHERTDARRCDAVQEMEVGPPEPAVRGRLQTTASCDGQEPWW